MARLKAMIRSFWEAAVLLVVCVIIIALGFIALVLIHNVAQMIAHG